MRLHRASLAQHQGCIRKRAHHILFHQVSGAMFAGDSFEVLIKVNSICCQWQRYLYVGPLLILSEFIFLIVGISVHSLTKCSDALLKRTGNLFTLGANQCKVSDIQGCFAKFTAGIRHSND